MVAVSPQTLNPMSTNGPFDDPSLLLAVPCNLSRALFLITSADTHPLVVPRVQARLAQQFGSDEAAGQAWSAHWFREGLVAYEAQLEPGCTRCHGEALSIADLALASHLVGVERFGVDLTEFPRTAAVGESLFALPEFAAAHPRLQLGAPGLGLPG